MSTTDDDLAQKLFESYQRAPTDTWSSAHPVVKAAWEEAADVARRAGLAALAARNCEAEMANPSGCACDFCSGKKRWADNWCARCAKVQMTAPKWWENCDVCDACEEAVAREADAERAREARP